MSTSLLLLFHARSHLPSVNVSSYSYQQFNIGMMRETLISALFLPLVNVEIKLRGNNLTNHAQQMNPPNARIESTSMIGKCLSVKDSSEKAI